MKKTTLLKALFAAIILSISSLIHAQEPTYPEVSSMEELLAALDNKESVTVLYKNLEPVVTTKGLFSEYYMPDATTALKAQGTIPTKFDAIGTLQADTFTIDNITNIHSFHNLYAAANYYLINATEKDFSFQLISPVTITAINGNNYFVQFQDLNKLIHGSLITITDENNLKIGDKITIQSITCSPANSSSELDNGTNEKINHINSGFFTTNIASTKIIAQNQKIKYTTPNLQLRELNHRHSSVALILPRKGKIEVENNDFHYAFYDTIPNGDTTFVFIDTTFIDKDTILNYDTIVKDKISCDKLKLITNSIDLNTYADQIIDNLILGVLDNKNTSTSSQFIVNEIIPIPSYQNISEWITVAEEYISWGTLEKPIIVTAKTPENSQKIKLFIEDATGAICLNYQFDTKPYKITTINQNDLISGVNGILEVFTAAGTPMAPTISLTAADTAQLTVIGQGTPIQPMVVTIAELKEDEKNILTNNIVARKYANRLVKIQGVVKGANFVSPQTPRNYPLIQGKDTLVYNYNTLMMDCHRTWFKTTPMCVTGIVDFQNLQTAGLYSIYPRSAEDIITNYLTPPSFTPKAGTYVNEVNVELISFDESVVSMFYSLDGSDPIDGEEYIDPINLTTTTTIKAISLYDVNSDNPYSEISEATYIITDKIETETNEPQLLAVVYSNNGNVIINTEVGNSINIYTLQGQQIYSAKATSETTTINALNNNILLVRINDQTIKVAIK